MDGSIRTVEAAKPCPAFSNETLTKEKLTRTIDARARTAVLVVHGMGQQRKFETLSSVIDGIESIGCRATKRCARNVRVGDERLSRMEVTLKDGREVDFYEAYWAPFTEGQVNLRDVMSFLWTGALNGLRNTGKPFRRWMFGEHEEFENGHPMAPLAFTAAVLGALVFMNSIIALLGVAKATNGGPDWIKSPSTVGDLTASMLMFLLVVAGFAVMLGLAALQRKPRGGRTKLLAISRCGYWFFYGTAFTAVVTAVTMGLRLTMAQQRGARWAAAADIAGLSLTFIAAAILAAGAIACVLTIVGVQRRIVSLAGAAALALLALVTIRLGIARSAGMQPTAFIGLDLVAVAAGWTTALQNVPKFWIVIWGALLAVSKKVRGFLVQYVGDVAAYVTPSALDRFDNIRDRIKECVFKTANAIYRAGEGEAFRYDSVVFVGHSLGSVAAYDCLNRMLNEDGHANLGLRVRERTKGLLTFGSPLDKTAFIFETNISKQSKDRAALCATVQPLIADPLTKSIRWVNVYSKWDIISGALNFYSKPDDNKRIKNRIDYDAVKPLAAHTEYWENPRVWHFLNEMMPERRRAAMAPAKERLKIRKDSKPSAERPRRPRSDSSRDATPR